MTGTSSKLLIFLILVLLGNLPAGLCCVLYRTSFGEAAITALMTKMDGFAAVSAGAEFSMLGFLAAIMALFSLIGQTEALRRYRINGGLAVLLITMAFTMAEIALAFCFSIALFFPPTSHGLLAATFIALVGSFGMLLVSLTPCIGLQLLAAKEA